MGLFDLLIAATTAEEVIQALKTWEGHEYIMRNEETGEGIRLHISNYDRKD